MEGARASTKLLRRKRRVESDAPSTTLRVVPLPRWRGGGCNKFPFSRCAFCSRARAMSKPVPKTPPQSRPSSDRSGSGEPDPSRSGAAICSPDERSDIRERRSGFIAAPGYRLRSPGLRKNEEKKERKQNAERRNFTNRRACKARRASSGTRTPSGVPLRLSPKGLTHPKDSASDQASRSAAPVSGGVLPPAPAPVAASTSHAGHSAGRHDVRAARERR